MKTMETAPTDRVICVLFKGGIGAGHWHVIKSGGLWLNDGRQPNGEPVCWTEVDSNEDHVMDCRRIGPSGKAKPTLDKMSAQLQEYSQRLIALASGEQWTEVEQREAERIGALSDALFIEYDKAVKTAIVEAYDKGASPKLGRG